MHGLAVFGSNIAYHLLAVFNAYFCDFVFYRDPLHFCLNFAKVQTLWIRSDCSFMLIWEQPDQG